ncbi:hypothetical protein A7M82_10105 [Acinetobacter baumannii]|uniref:hypothetical protein n=1 Tax=Acinetobacter baumannii TaxID=470 RepID=UPI0008DD3E52|nr:hypothetical protein [Acinetobacter baumannii]OIG77080.1 hypothetical protein A7M82_10105 [Acinetobacter baumannii]
MSEAVSTLKQNFKIELTGFRDPSITKQSAAFFTEILLELSTLTDLTGLEGVTFAINDEEYLKKLKSFDERLAPSNDDGVGVAMTISSIGGDFSKNYIVLNCTYLELEHIMVEYAHLTSEEKKNEVINKFAHILFHEMCHVNNNIMLFNNFNRFSITTEFENKLQAMKHSISRVTWDEFAVCAEANQIGVDQTDSYEGILFDVLSKFEERLEYIYKDYMIRASTQDNSVYSDLFNNTYLLVYNLFKYAAYYFGDIFTKDENEISQKLLKHEFGNYLLRLNNILSDIYQKLSKDIAQEEDLYKVGDLAEEFISYLGLIVYPTENNGMFVNLSESTQARILNL